MLICYKIKVYKDNISCLSVQGFFLCFRQPVSPPELVCFLVRKGIGVGRQPGLDLTNSAVATPSPTRLNSVYL